MIERKVGDKMIQFEMSIGMYKQAFSGPFHSEKIQISLKFTILKTKWYHRESTV